MSRDTLLIVTTSYPMASDGSEAAGSFVADFAKAMTRYMPVRVVGPGLVEGIDISCDAVTVRRFASASKPLSLLSPLKPWHWFSIVRILYSLRAQTLAADSDGRIKHILALWVLPSGWAARVLARSSNIPYSVWALGSDIWSLGRLPVIREILAQVCSEADTAYADGLQLATDGEKISGRPFVFLPSSRLFGAVRTKAVAHKPPFRFVFLGRWHRNKGIDILMDALGKLTDADWRSIDEVHIAGGGPLHELVHDAVNALKLKGRAIRISGYLDREHAAEALSSADRLLLPSRVESIPVIFSDAMTCGLPVVAMPVGDLPVLIGTDIGWLAPNVSVSGFLQAIRDSLIGQHNPNAFACIANKFDINATTFKLSRRMNGSAND
jgi:glycosyltransferase involved in cell wall biosynthesis